MLKLVINKYIFIFRFGYGYFKIYIWLRNLFLYGIIMKVINKDISIIIVLVGIIIVIEFLK